MAATSALAATGCNMEDLDLDLEKDVAVPGDVTNLDPSGRYDFPAGPGRDGGVAEQGPPLGAQVATVRTPDGPMQLAYEVVDGEMIAEGDIVLGKVSEVGVRANLVAGARWPGGRIGYWFASDIPTGDPRRTNVANAIADIEAKTPIRFELRAPSCSAGTPCLHPIILISSHARPGVGNSAVGYDASAGGAQSLRLGSSTGLGVTIHELGHAIGMYHEQSRADRDGYLVYRPECVESGATSAFTINGGSAMYGWYDFASVMHYASNGFRRPDPAAGGCNNGYPITRKMGTQCPTGTCRDLDGDGFTEYINAASTLSPGDVTAILAMYQHGNGANESGDFFGYSMAFGDFDGDRFLDLAVGAYGESFEYASGRVAFAGALNIYKASAMGYEPWRTIDQSNLGSAVEAQDSFGRALAVGDFNGDGYDDLAASAPNEGLGSAQVAAGAVFVIYGSATGLGRSQLLIQAMLGGNDEAGDQFGSALVAGDFDGDGFDDLAIGAAGEAPFSDPNSGYVYVLRGTATNLVAWRQLSQETTNAQGVALGVNQANEGFGEALAAGDLDNDGRDDLVVGAPYDSHDVSHGGGVYVFRSSASGLIGWKRLQQNPLGLNETDDRFGAAVAVGNANSGYAPEIIVGAPGEDYGTTRDVGYVFVFKRNGDDLVGEYALTQSGLSSDLVDEQFGASLAHDGLAIGSHLVVGIPDNQQETSFRRPGGAMVFEIENGRMVAKRVLDSSSVLGAGILDHMGTSVAIRPATSVPGLAIAVGGPSVGGYGAVAIYNGNSNVVDQTITQSTTGSRN